MFCSKCGIENADGTQYCKNCGAPLKAPGASGPAPDGQNFMQNGAPYFNVAPPPMLSPAAVAVKRVCSSPAALVAIVAYTLGVIVQFITSFVNFSNTNYLYIFLRRYGLDFGELEEYIQRLSSTSLVSAIIGIIPSVLIAVGLWLAYTSAAQKGVIKTAGITLIKVILIITLVFLCIIFSFALIVLIVAAGAAGEYFGSEGGAAVAVVLVVFLVVAVLTILFYAKAIQTSNAVSRTLRFGAPSNKASSFLAVAAIVIGVFDFIGAFLPMAIFNGSFDALSFISSLISAVSFITFGVFVFMYRGAMNALTVPVSHAPANFGYAPNQPPYGFPPQNGYNAPNGANGAYNGAQQYSAPSDVPPQNNGENG